MNLKSEQALAKTTHLHFTGHLVGQLEGWGLESSESLLIHLPSVNAGHGLRHQLKMLTRAPVHSPASSQHAHSFPKVSILKRREKEKEHLLQSLTQILLVFLPEDTFQFLILHQRQLGEYKEAVEAPGNDKNKLSVSLSDNNQTIYQTIIKIPEWRRMEPSTKL